MDPAADLETVKHHIVRAGMSLEILGCPEKRDVGLLRRGERVMNRNVTCLLLTVFEEREIGHPEKLELVAQ